MGFTTGLRREVKTRSIPFVTDSGFGVQLHSMPQSMVFRRTVGEVTHIFELQWEKYGRPRFAVNFGTCPNRGVSVAGQSLEDPELEAYRRNGRIGPHMLLWHLYRADPAGVSCLTP